MSAKKEKPALAAPVSENEKPGAVDSTPSARTRKHDSRFCICPACILRELRLAAVRLQDAVDDAEKENGFPVRVAELCLWIGGYGRFFKVAAGQLNVVLDPEAEWNPVALNDGPEEQEAFLRLRDVADKPGGDA
jgi:hypothetical protein